MSEQLPPTVKRSKMPWWGVAGWAMALFALVSWFFTQMQADSVSSIAGQRDSEPFMSPVHLVLLCAGLLLGVAGLVVKSLGSNKDAQ